MKSIICLKLCHIFDKLLILSSDWTKTQRLGKSKTCVGSATTKCQQFSKLLLMKCRKLN